MGEAKRGTGAEVRRYQGVQDRLLHIHLGWHGLTVFCFLVLPVYCYQPISLHPHACMLSHVRAWTAAQTDSFD